MVNQRATEEAITLISAREQRDIWSYIVSHRSYIRKVVQRYVPYQAEDATHDVMVALYERYRRRPDSMDYLASTVTFAAKTVARRYARIAEREIPIDIDALDCQNAYHGSLRAVANEIVRRAEQTVVS